MVVIIYPHPLVYIDLTDLWGVGWANNDLRLFWQSSGDFAKKNSNRYLPSGVGGMALQPPRLRQPCCGSVVQFCTPKLEAG